MAPRHSRYERPAAVRDALTRAPRWALWPMPRRIVAIERRLPAWLHPTYRGAVCVLGLWVGVAGKLVVLTVLVILMLMVGPRPGMGLFLGLLGVTVVAGAAGGTIHGILRPLDQWGRIGAWLRWFLAIIGAVFACVVLTPDGPFSVQEGAFHVLALGIAALGAGGLLLLDDRRPGRPTPRRFRWLQSRERLWAAADRACARRSHLHPSDASGPRSVLAGVLRHDGGPSIRSVGLRGLLPARGEEATVPTHSVPSGSSRSA